MKKYPVKACNDCGYCIYDYHVGKWYCAETEKNIPDPEVIDPNCKLEDYE